MKTFVYTAYTAKGRRSRGVISAEDEADAVRLIGARGLLPSDISQSAPGAGGAASRRFKRIDVDEMSVFTRQMAVLLHAGLSADAALDAVQVAVGSGRIEALASRTRAGLLEGAPLAEALGRSGLDLPPFFLAAVRAGEHTGELPVVFATLADHLETAAGERLQLASALIYPAFVTVVAVFVCGVLMSTVVPEITSMFEATGQELPALTKAVLGIFNVVRTNWQLFLAAIVGLSMVGVAAAWVPALRQRRDWLLLRMPFSRRFIRMSAAAQYLRTLALVINSRLPLQEALHHAAGVLTMARFRAEADTASEALRRGETLAASLGRVSFLHPVARQLLQAGEASARLGPMSERAAILAETWARAERKRSATLLEPLSMIVVGALVLVIVLAVLLPIFDMQSLVGRY